VGTFVLAAALAFSLTLLPDTMGDLGEYCRWTRRLVARGLDGAYFPSSAERIVAGADPSWAIDYPAVLPYLLWVIGHIADWFAAGAAQHDRLMGFLIGYYSQHWGFPPFALSRAPIERAEIFEARAPAPAIEPKACASF
jgi:hypothetical protein